MVLQYSVVPKAWDGSIYVVCMSDGGETEKAKHERVLPSVEFVPIKGVLSRTMLFIPPQQSLLARQGSF